MQSLRLVEKMRRVKVRMTYFISFFYIVPLVICLQGWCKRMAFRPGGKYLPYDWVDEGKLLLFVKTQVAERAPRKGSRLAAEKKL